MFLAVQHFLLSFSARRKSLSTWCCHQPVECGANDPMPGQPGGSDRIRSKRTTLYAINFDTFSQLRDHAGKVATKRQPSKQPTN